MTTRRFTCQFHRRTRNVPYGFACRRNHQVVNAYIADNGHYELDVWADDRRAPIPTVPGDWRPRPMW
jgi:hypothetical protein